MGGPRLCWKLSPFFGPQSSNCPRKSWLQGLSGPPALSWSCSRGLRGQSQGVSPAFLNGGLIPKWPGPESRLGDPRLSPLTAKFPQHPYTIHSPFQALTSPRFVPIFFFSFFFLWPCLQHMGSQAKGRIGAAVASLHYNCSNTRSKPPLRPMLMADS